MANNTPGNQKITKLKHRKRCKKCGKIMNTVWFSAIGTDEWEWTGKGYESNLSGDSLIFDAHFDVICPHCSATVGDGYEFGFGTEKITLIGKL